MDIFLILAKGLKILLNPPALRECKISKKAKICSKSDLNFTMIDDYSYMGYQCYAVHVKIGKFCSIGDNCRIGGASHPLDWTSTSPVFQKGNNVLKTNFSNLAYEPFKETIIENDVWIGANVLIKSGVRISNGSVIGMGSVITHDIGPYEIWGGNPAKCIRKRFDEDTIKELLSSKWWHMDDSTIRKYAQHMADPKVFLSKIKSI